MKEKKIFFVGFIKNSAQLKPQFSEPKETEFNVHFNESLFFFVAWHNSRAEKKNV